MTNELKESITKQYENAGDKLGLLNSIRAFLHDISPNGNHPVDNVKWVDLDKVEPNDYNPNQVAKVEMGLLYKSIEKDGYTQPIVTIYDPEKDKYVIVDGFHRYYVAKTQADILESTNGKLPVVVIKKSINERMASTVRHNRARGKHTIQGMSSMVFKMLDNGWSDEDICSHLGMEAEELLKLKHITGFSKLFENVEYKRAWENRAQIRIRKEFEKANDNKT